MAFTYVPVPVYNLGGMGMQAGGVGMPGMPGAMGMQGGMGMPGAMGMPGGMGMAGAMGMPGGLSSMNYSSMSGGQTSPTKGDKSESQEPAATSTPMHTQQPSSMDNSQMNYQQAFLQNAVAQNMQIQQQLLMQNQALTQLLQQTSSMSLSANNQSSASPTRDVKTASPAKPVPVYFGMNDIPRRSSEGAMIHSQHEMHEEITGKPRSKTAPNTPKNSTNIPPDAPPLPGGPMNAYMRAKTVRIGNWRWPPPKEAIDGDPEGFFEFKMRKMGEKRSSLQEQQGGSGNIQNESLETSGEIQGLEWGDFQEDLNSKGMKRAVSKDSFTIMDDSPDGQKRSEKPTPGNSHPGRLKISNEMKEKLEAAMGSRKSSVRSTTKTRGELELPQDGEDVPEQAVKKLNENRKLLLEQKLGGGGKLKKWEGVEENIHRATEEKTSRKSSYESKGNVPIPPPPPIAPSLVKPLHVETNNQRRSTSPGSSYYSPGGSTPLVPETRGPPPPVQPAGDQLDGYRRSVDRERLNSVSTHQTEKTERYELEESSEFLQPIVDEKGPNIMDELDYQALEEIKTKHHPPQSTTHFSYNRVPWKLKIRKEVFSPSEQLNNPSAIHLVFCQIVADVYSPLCIRITQAERKKMVKQLDQFDININNIHSSQHKTSSTSTSTTSTV